ncbi:MAG: hypothetical protein ACTSO9_03255 [Candidatus Helarchaeota archaeon]
MEETLKTLKNIAKSFEDFAVSLEKATQRINKIHNLVDEKIGMLSKDTHEMAEFIKKENEKSNKLIKDLVEETIKEIKMFYEYFELEKVNKMVQNLNTEISVPELKKTASTEELKTALSELKEISKQLKERV